MTQRILKDIRFFESENENTNTQKMPQELGTLFTPTKDTKYIGQRIARKLNELQYSYGGVDHIYICLSAFLKEDEMVIAERNLDPRIKYLDYGVSTEKFNGLSEQEKNNLIQSVTFKLLKHISDGQNLTLVGQTEKLMAEFGTEIKIHYKSKESNAHSIAIYYQIEAENGGTKAIIEFKDKKTNSCSVQQFPLRSYEDIYTLVDTITLKADSIVLQPKKSVIAAIHNQAYSTPIVLPLKGFKKTDCR